MIRHYADKLFSFDRKYVFHGGFWLLTGHAATVVTVLLTSYVFANYLSPEIYGEYKYLISLGALLTTFSLTGAAIAISQGAAKNVAGFFSYTAKMSLKYGLIVSGLAAIGSVYYYLNDNLSLALGLLIIAFLQPFFNNSSLIFAYLQGSQRFKLSTKAHIFKTLTVAAVVIGATLLVQSALYTFLAFLLASIATGYSITFFYRPKREELEETEGRKLISYAKHTSARNMLSSIAGQLDKILIFQNLGAGELATYAFAVAIPDQLKGFTKTIKLLTIPRYTKYTKDTIKKTIRLKIVLYVLFSSCLVVIYAALAPHVFKALYPNYSESIILSQIYSINLIFGFGVFPLTALNTNLQEKRLYALQTVTAVYGIFSTILLLLIFGIIGVIFARISQRLLNGAFATYLFFYERRE